MIRVILVEDHALFRMGIKETFNARYPDIEVVGENITTLQGRIDVQRNCQQIGC